MHAKAQPSMQVVRKEEKEVRLRQFIEAELALSAATAPSQGSARELMLVARSTESPVVKAIASLAPDLASAGWTLRALLILADGQDGAAAAPAELALLGPAFRCADTLRLIDAHEQLVLSARAVWIGDCMRRDPAKRDAFEYFTTEGGPMAAWSAIAFARLWQHGLPFDAPASSLLPAEAGEDQRTAHPPAATPAGSPPATATVLTRH